MPLYTRIVALVVAALALGAVAAGCGGGEETPEVPAGAIALVGDVEIPKADYDRLLAQAEESYKAREQEFPQAGTPEFAQLRNAIVRTLVEQTEYEIVAEEMGIEVTDADVEKRLDELKEQYFQGNEEQYRDELEKQGLNDAQVREQLRAQLIGERVFEEVTKSVKVSDQEIDTYYEENRQQFETPASREVRHILVSSKRKADDLYEQLRGGANFARLARQHTEDEGSKEQGGKFTAQRGATVPPFDRTAFELDTGELSRPVKTQFGWHIIEAVGDVEDASAQPLSEVEEQIRQQLLQEKQNTRINEWLEELRQRFEDELVYAPGFEPPPPAETTTGEDGDTGTEPAETDTGQTETDTE